MLVVVALQVVQLLGVDLQVLEGDHEVDAPPRQDQVDGLRQEKIEGVTVPVELSVPETVDEGLFHD